MSVLGDFKNQQFAVIAVHGEPCRERLVLAYGDEKTLRACLAESNILGLGYRTREEALASLDSLQRRCLLRNKMALQKMTAWRLRYRVTEFLGRQLRPERFGSWRPQSTIVQGLHHGFAILIVLFSSKNFFSTAVRTLISF